MNQQARCDRCNCILVNTDTEPVCPACLIRQTFEPEETSPQDGRRAEVSKAWGGREPSIADDAAEPTVELAESTDSAARLRPLATGEHFGDYEIIRLLGRGGMGVVYEAIQGATSRRVALKLLERSLGDSQARSRFLREGRLAASINHPNSVYVYGTEEIDGIPAIAMELMEEGTLRDKVANDGRFSCLDAADAVLQMIDGLEEADRRGILHRDVKPSNCFVSSDGTVKVGDYGLSISTTGRETSEADDVTAVGSFLGTPAYASPEQLRGEPLDHRSDIYAVGVTLYHLMTGTVPFHAGNMVQMLALVLDQQAPHASSKNPYIAPEIDRLISRCLEKSAGQRFATYDELRTALRPLSRQSPAPASLASRALAGLVDACLCWIVILPFGIYQGMVAPPIAEMPRFVSAQSTWLAPLAMVLVFSYFTLSEWNGGQSVGKRLLKIRVASRRSSPKLWQAATRALLYSTTPAMVAWIAEAVFQQMTVVAPFTAPKVAGLAFLTVEPYLVKFGLFIGANRSNGSRAIHDRLSGTQVFDLSIGSAKNASRSAAPKPDDVEKVGTIGPYHRLRLLRDEWPEQLLLAYDPQIASQCMDSLAARRSAAGLLARSTGIHFKCPSLAGRKTDKRRGLGCL